MSRPPSSRAALCLALAGLLFGCSQGYGERCEQNSDCSSGVCSTPSAVSATGGRCCASTTQCPSVAETDASTFIDGGVIEAGQDGPEDAPIESLPADAPAAEAATDTTPADDAAAADASSDAGSPD